MLIAPFEIKAHEGTIHEAGIAVKDLHKFISGDKYITHEYLIQQIDTMDRYLKNRDEEYKEKAKTSKREVDKSQIPASLRSFEHLGILAGGLSKTSNIVQRMSSEIKGLGLPIVCSGAPERTGETHSGGYGSVYKMTLPTDALGLEDIKNSKRAVAVKIAHAKSDVAEANLRMLREADRWSAVSRDWRKLKGGGEYIAEVLGVWDNFLNGRPGLISLWGDCDLATYIRDTNPSTLRRLQILHKIAQGVNYLHTCRPPIVHGDLKATNVIMVDGEPALTDFGVSKCLDEIKGFTTGNAYTDDYRAPELQYRAVSLVKDPSTTSDVYAFGCVIFESISGKHPYDGYDADTRKRWIEHTDDITPVDAELNRTEGIPFPFERPQLKLMSKCFAFHASKRPLMSEVVQDLDELCLAFED